MRIFLIIFFGMFFSSYTASAQNKVNQLDANKERHGIWKKTYTQSKQLRYEGEFEHGKEIGTFKFYCETCGDQPEAVKEFDAKNGTAKVKFYSKEGKLLSEGNMEAKNKIGEWMYYAEESKAIIMRENYVDGKLDGEKTTYYQDGAITERLQFVKGKQEGESIYLSPKGKVLKKLYYKDGLLNGPAEYYDAYGNRTMKGFYKDGMKSGAWTYYKGSKVLFEKYY